MKQALWKIILAFVIAYAMALSPLVSSLSAAPHTLSSQTFDVLCHVEAGSDNNERSPADHPPQCCVMGCFSTGATVPPSVMLFARVRPFSEVKFFTVKTLSAPITFKALYQSRAPPVFS
jgi:hypothetical protein